MSKKQSLANFNFINRVLKNLPADAIERLQLRLVDLPANRPIEVPGEPIAHLFFLEAGAASTTTTFEDGSQVEVGLFGFEAILCVAALMGTRRSMNRVYMQIAGHGFAAPIAAAKAEFARCGEFQRLFLRNVQAQQAQIGQSAGCNAKHDVEQRLARWLLLCADRTGTQTLAISQDFVATMLGVRRMSASAAIAYFKRLGLVDHQRGRVQILNPAGLEEKACECYRAVKHHLDSVAEFDTGFAR